MNDIGLDEIMEATVFCTGGSRCPLDICIKIGSRPSCTKKKNHTEWCGFLLVDDIGLEPMTFRTSSGCSSQLS